MSGWRAGLALRTLCGGAVLLTCLLTASSDRAAENQDTAVFLDKEVHATGAVSLTPLYVHDEQARTEIDKLRTKEKRLLEIEASLAADLTRGVGRLVKSTAESRRRTWYEETVFYRAVAGAAGLAGEAVGYLDAEAPSLRNLYWFCDRVAREIDLAAVKRQQLEAKYFEQLAGAPATSKKAYFGLPAETASRIRAAARQRVLDVRLMRQNTLESLLLASRAAREAQHLYGLAEKFAVMRRTGHLLKQRQALIDEDASYSSDLLRRAYLDHGLVALAKQELQAEDAFDQMQLYRFSDVLNSLIAANELDYTVVPSDLIDEMEGQMAFWNVTQEWGAFATKIGDALIWHLINQEISGLVDKYVGGALGIKPARARPMTFNEKVWWSAKFVYGRTNPLLSIVSVEDLLTRAWARSSARSPGRSSPRSATTPSAT